jgi:hypothetical protein
VFALGWQGATPVREAHGVLGHVDRREEATKAAAEDVGEDVGREERLASELGPTTSSLMPGAAGVRLPRACGIVGVDLPAERVGRRSAEVWRHRKQGFWMASAGRPGAGEGRRAGLSTLERHGRMSGL